jgi:hypothetical protein
MESAERTPNSRPEQSVAVYRRLRITLLAVITLLIAQFVKGMGINLFAIFPSGRSGVSAEQELVKGVLQTGPGLVIHVVVGLVILAMSVVAVYFSPRAGGGAVVRMVVLGLVSVLLALVGGVAFVLSGFQNNAYSLLMALGFIFAISSYFVELNLSGRVMPLPDQRHETGR